MKMKIHAAVILISIVFLICSPGLMAQGSGDKAEVTLPWQEFRKLLELDKDEIVLSWDEFQKILSQTGRSYVPPYKLKDEKVLLSRAQFKKLLDQMKPPVTTTVAPPADYLITKANYTGKWSNGSVMFRADLDVEIFEKERNHYVKIPLFPQSVALRDVQFDGKSALAILENGQHTVATTRVGKHRITVLFSLKVPVDRGARAFSFPIPKAPINSMEFNIPMKDIEVEVGSAQQLDTVERGGNTRITALLTPSGIIDVKWRTKLPEVKKGPAKIYADTLNHLSIEDDALRVYTDLSLTVLQNTIPSIALKLPDGWSILNVSGQGLGDWQELERENVTYLEIPFEYPKKGTFTITITAEKLLIDESTAVEFTGFSVVNAVRDKGFVGVELKSTSEVTLSGSEGLDKLDVSELPAQLINRTQKPLLMGFKYLHHPLELVLDVQKHEELPVIGTVVDSANGVTLFTEDGKLVHRVVYKVRNTSKQFLELTLPEDAQIWSVFVGGNPEKPRLSENKILIPLNRSRAGAAGLAAFDVELIYFQKAERFSWYGSRESAFPVPDVIVSQVLWSIYLPVGYNFLHFGGTMEKEKKASGFLPLLVGGKQDASTRVVNLGYAGEDKEMPALEEMDELKKQFSPNLGLEKEQLAAQMKNERVFSQKVMEVQGEGASTTVSGVLPIRIQVPTTGQIFRFAKTIVSEEELTISFCFVSGKMRLVVKLLVILLILLILLFLRKKILALVFFLKGKFKPIHTPFVLLVLGVLLWNISGPLAILLILLVPFSVWWLWRKRNTFSFDYEEEKPAQQDEE